MTNLFSRSFSALLLLALIMPNLGSSQSIPNQPTIGPFPGTYTNSVTITMSASTLTAKIYYTTDGTDPISSIGGSALLYTNPFILSSTASIKARAFYGAPLGTSLVRTSTYTIVSLPTAATPTFSPESGEYIAPVVVSMSTTTPGAVIRYTSNGTDPTQSSTVHNGPFTLSSTRTIRARAYASGMNPSAVASATYAITAAPTPTPTPQPTPTPEPTPAPAPTFLEWVSQKGLTGNDASPDADPDQDSLANLVEYHMGLAPTLPDANGTIISNNLAVDPPTVSIIYQRSTNTTGVTDNVLWTTALNNGEWSTNGVLQSVQETGAYQKVTATVTNASGETSKFLRLRVHQQ
jgi:hypothetical protein